MILHHSVWLFLNPLFLFQIDEAGLSVQPGLHKRVISYPVDLAFSGFRSLAVSALIVNTERMRGYWQRSAGFIAVFGCVLFSMRVYTSVTIEMWHNHLVTELVIKCCSFVVSLKTDIYLPWSQRVGEWRVVWYENRRRGKKEASASPTIACGSHLWYSSLSVRLCVFYLFIWKTNQTALLLKPRVKVCVYTRVCVHLGSVCSSFRDKDPFQSPFPEHRCTPKQKRVLFGLHPSPDLLCEAHGAADSCGLGPLTGCGLHSEVTSVGFTFPLVQPAWGVKYTVS